MLGMTLSDRRKLVVVVVAPAATPADADLERGGAGLNEGGEGLEAVDVLPVNRPRGDVDRERQGAQAGNDDVERVRRVLQLRMPGGDRHLLVREGSRTDYHLDVMRRTDVVHKANK